MQSQRRAEILLFLVTFVWGSTFVITKDLLEHASPFWYSAIRFSFATLLSLAIFNRKLLPFSLATMRRGMVLGLLLYAGFLAQTTGLRYTTSSKSAFFTGLLTVLTPVIQLIYDRSTGRRGRNITRGNVIGVLLATAGLYLLTSPVDAAFNRGDALTLCCAFFFAGYIVYLDAISHDANKVQLTFWQFAVSAAAGLIIAPLTETMSIAWTPGFFLSLSYLTVFATIITMLIQVKYQGDTTPARAAVIFAMEPVVAGVLGYFVRDERIGTVGLFGALMIVTGVLASELIGKKELKLS
ncbi:MAG TPA: DMT family transporter [Bacteroidota bacterium]|nr:DMT family transporter [Bacteroidota bacterium]